MTKRVFRVAAAILMGCLAMPSSTKAAEIFLDNALSSKLHSLRLLYGGGEWGGAERVFEHSNQNFKIIRISGAIEKGDAEKLQKIINSDTYTPTYVVLNSPGGNFLEGFRIGETFKRHREGNDSPVLQGVVVLKGESCLSACAIAFAMAARPRDVGASVRFLEDGAKLGFHMGFLPDRISNQSVEIKEALNIGYDISAQFLRLIIDGVSPPQLFEKALEHRDPTSFYYVEADLTARFYGFTPVAADAQAEPVLSSGLSVSQIEQLCLKLHAWRPVVKHTDEELDFFEHHVLGYDTGGEPRSDFESLLTEQGGKTTRIGKCIFSRSPSGIVSFTVDENVVQATSCIPGQFLPWCQIDKVLEDYLSPVSVALFATVLGCPSGTLEPKYNYESGKWEKTWRIDAASDVSIRSEPSTGSKRIGYLQAGESVLVEDCAIASDTQGVWFKVSSGNQSGWASARYIF